MNLREVELKYEYRSFEDDIVNDFYIPTLEKAVEYKRAVGFFSSTGLLEISKGISRLAQNGGKIKLITSPVLSEEDIEAISIGYADREKIIKERLVDNLFNYHENEDLERLNLLANLIADGTLDIKVAVLNTKHGIGMYHEKVGIISDTYNNKVVFSGSMNESVTAMKINYESIDVFCSWKDSIDRIESKERSFDDIWDNRNKNIQAIEIPDVKDEFIERYRTGEPNYEIDQQEPAIKEKEEPWIKKPDYVVELYEYQQEAINNWAENNYRGIFDMATGTGKTLTALGGLSKLEKELDSNLGIIVVCPYQHLVEQWVEDIEECGVKPLKCYSAYNWKSEYERTIRNFNMGITKNFFIVTTNMTFTTDFFQENVDKLSGNICLVVDEAHNFGTKRQIKTMKDVFKYRLALSATIERHGDEEGTKKLYDFFEGKVIEYNLEEAIRDGRLSRYYYYPIPISLTDEERDKYDELSGKIGRARASRGEEDDPSESEKMLLIQRARIIAGADNKIPALCEILEEKYISENHILVYCGSANSNDYNYIEGKPELEEKRQIDVVMNKLGNDVGMRISKFTSEENNHEREMIKENFEKGDIVQALIAIRCLDEGVNIPSIETAFILASSTNPKEYIQRRGRVLRLSKGKDYAEIYDFITLPEDINNLTGKYNVSKYELNLIEREFKRVKEFANLAENPMDSYNIEMKLKETYELYYGRGD